MAIPTSVNKICKALADFAEESETHEELLSVKVDGSVDNKVAVMDLVNVLVDRLAPGYRILAARDTDGSIGGFVARPPKDVDVSKEHATPAAD